MNVDGGGELGVGGAAGHGDDGLVDQVAGVGPGDVAAQDVVGLRVGDEFDQAAGVGVARALTTPVKSWRPMIELETRRGGSAAIEPTGDRVTACVATSQPGERCVLST